MAWADSCSCEGIAQANVLLAPNSTMESDRWVRVSGEEPPAPVPAAALAAAFRERFDGLMAVVSSSDDDVGAAAAPNSDTGRRERGRSD